MQCVILAGGRGTRMNQYTSRMPKSLIPVAGKPFIDHQLSHLAHTGVSDVVLCIGYQGTQIQDHVKEGKAWGLRIRYVEEGEQLQGTAGALRLALQRGALNSGFLLTYGDSYLPVDFSEVWRFFEGQAEPLLMTVYKNDNRWGASNVIFQDGKVTLYDKSAGGKNPAMHYLDYGLSALRKDVIEKDVPPSPYDLAEVFKKRSLQGGVAGYEVAERFYEVGSPEGLRDLSDYLSRLQGEKTNGISKP